MIDESYPQVTPEAVLLRQDSLRSGLLVVLSVGEG